MKAARNGLWLGVSVAFLLGALFSPSSLVAQNNFLRGDANCDGCVNALDAWDLLNSLFKQIPLPSDCNQDGTLDISDPICMLGFLFMGTPDKLPCGEGEADHPSNMMLLDHNGDNKFDMSDAIGLLQFLFSHGKPPSRGRGCIYIDRCPQNPKCPPFTP